MIDEYGELDDMTDAAEEISEDVEFSEEMLRDISTDGLTDIDGVSEFDDELEAISDAIDISSDVDQLNAMKDYLLEHRELYDTNDDSDDEQKVLKLR